MNKQRLCRGSGPHRLGFKSPWRMCGVCRTVRLVRSARLWMTSLLSGILLCLVASLTGCASGSTALPDTSVACTHPIVATATVGGLVEGLTSYADALDTCNALNGHYEIKDAP